MKFGRRLLTGLREAGIPFNTCGYKHAGDAEIIAERLSNDGCVVVGWEDHYINYEALKGIIRAATADHADENHVSELLELFAKQLQVS
jgi:hypothetical protein